METSLPIKRSADLSRITNIGKYEIVPGYEKVVTEEELVRLVNVFPEVFASARTKVHFHGVYTDCQSRSSEICIRISSDYRYEESFGYGRLYFHTKDEINQFILRWGNVPYDNSFWKNIVQYAKEAAESSEANCVAQIKSHEQQIMLIGQKMVAFRERGDALDHLSSKGCDLSNIKEIKSVMMSRDKLTIHTHPLSIFLDNGAVLPVGSTILDVNFSDCRASINHHEGESYCFPHMSGSICFGSSHSAIIAASLAACDLETVLPLAFQTIQGYNTSGTPYSRLGVCAERMGIIIDESSYLTYEASKKEDDDEEEGMVEIEDLSGDTVPLPTVANTED